MTTNKWEDKDLPGYLGWNLFKEKMCTHDGVFCFAPASWRIIQCQSWTQTPWSTWTVAGQSSIILFFFHFSDEKYDLGKWLGYLGWNLFKEKMWRYGGVFCFAPACWSSSADIMVYYCLSLFTIVHYCLFLKGKDLYAWQCILFCFCLLKDHPVQTSFCQSWSQTPWSVWTLWTVDRVPLFHLFHFFWGKFSLR